MSQGQQAVVYVQHIQQSGRVSERRMRLEGERNHHPHPSIHPFVRPSIQSPLNATPAQRLGRQSVCRHHRGRVTGPAAEVVTEVGRGGS